jgi:NTP pyrophosphatase (non-canonical NTP hydrolase)
MRKKEILAWADNKNLLKYENRFKQYSKLQEESNELYVAMLDDNKAEIIDGLGDCVIVLTILAEQLGYDLATCIEYAYDEIKNRTGKTLNGNFIKD